MAATHLSPSYSALAPEFCLNVSTTRAEFSAISNTTAAAAVSSSPSPGSSPSTSAAAKERAPWLADIYIIFRYVDRYVDIYLVFRDCETSNFAKVRFRL